LLSTLSRLCFSSISQSRMIERRIDAVHNQFIHSGGIIFATAFNSKNENIPYVVISKTSYHINKRAQVPLIHKGSQSNKRQKTKFYKCMGPKHPQNNYLLYCCHNTTRVSQIKITSIINTMNAIICQDGIFSSVLY
jgi:hypothetical protein